MLACTYVARNIYIWSLPHVALGLAENQTFTYEFFKWSALEEAPADSGYKWQTTVYLAREETGGRYNPDNYASNNIRVQVEPLFVYAFTGEIITVAYDSSGADVVIGCDFDLTDEEESQLAAGNRMMAVFSITARPADNVILRSAVQNDGVNHYVFIVKEKNGVFGREFTTERLDVSVVNTAGLYASFEPLYTAAKLVMEPIVTTSDKPLTPGISVRFYP